MARAFDRRVVPADVLELLRTCQRHVACHLGGGAALSGVYLAHRLSADVDLVCHDPAAVRQLARELPVIAGECQTTIDVIQDAGSFVRARLGGSRVLGLDITLENSPDLESPPAPVEGVVVESLTDLRAAKLTCLLSRSEPRDLVDLLVLERAGFRVEDCLPIALRRDAGIDPGVLAWLLGQFPIRPLPLMLLPLTEAELGCFRDDLRERLRKLAVPEG